jgi:uncharacterized lipoprotein YehR (DUF1307 family)
MKKAITILIGISIIVSLAGCADQGKKTENNAAQTTTLTQSEVTPSPTPVPSPTPRASEEPIKSSKASVAGIHLGDSIDALKEKFGSDFKETVQEQPSYYGQNISLLEYKSGVTAIVDNITKTVLEITVVAEDSPTNLGVKPGDSAKDVTSKYAAKYELFEGANSNGKLKGWYSVEEGELLIFDFKEGDSTHYNEKINEGDKVVSITLSNPKYFD